MITWYLVTRYNVWGGWALTESSTLSYQPLHLTWFICFVITAVIVFVFDVNKYYLTWLPSPPHSHKAHPRPHPFPIPVDSCIEVWDLQVRIMQHVFVCNRNFTLAVTVIYKKTLLSVQCSLQHWTEYKITWASVRCPTTRRLRPTLWAQFWTDLHQIWNIASPEHPE